MQRRHFLQLATAAPLATALQLHAEPRTMYAFLGTPRTLLTYAVQNNTWTKRHEAPAQNPSSLTRHPFLPILYATNEIDTVNHLPTGSITTYLIQPDGRLTPLQQTPLSLAATHPRAMALPPDATLAVVAASSAGIYNLFPVNANGQLGTLRGVLKETGNGPRSTSRPQHLCFDPAGHILAADPGSDRIHVLQTEASSLQLRRRYQTDPGTGPTHIALHPAAPFIALTHALRNELSVHSYDSKEGLIGSPLAILPGTSVPLHADHAALALQQGTTLTLHRWSPQNGHLQPLHTISVHEPVQSALLESRQLTLAANEHITEHNLTTGAQHTRATCPGLRCLAWPRAL